MKRKNLFVIFLTFIVINTLFACLPVLSAIIDLNRPAYTGARANGMGNAFTALADDADSILLNPAGLCQISNIQTSFEYFRPYLIASDISNNFFSIVVPLYNKKSKSPISMGIGYLGLSAPYYFEHTTILSFSIAPKRKGFAFGANLKYLNAGFSFGDITDASLKDDPLLSGDLPNLNIVACDLGIIYQPINYANGKRLNFGITFENMIKNKDSYYKDGIEFTLPEAIRIGGAWTQQLSYNSSELGNSIENMYIGSLTLASDFFYDLFDGDPKSLHLGCELWGRSKDMEAVDFSIRTGLEIAGKNKRKIMLPFLGSGIIYKFNDKFAITIDYSYSMGSYNLNEHRISSAIIFPKVFWQKSSQN